MELVSESCRSRATAVGTYRVVSEETGGRDEEREIVVIESILPC